MPMKTGGRPYTFDVMEMLEFRRQGMSYAALGRMYGKDHTTIMHSCKKFGVVPIEPIQPKGKLIRKSVDTGSIDLNGLVVYPAIQAPKPVKYAHIFDEPVCEGKSYAEYMAEARKRPVERRYLETWGSDPAWTGMYAGKKKKEGPSKRDLDLLEED